MNVDLSGFKLYKSGVFSDTKCKTVVDHYVLIVGFGIDGKKKFWNLKNSFGTGWGINGYMLLERLDNG